MTSGRAAALNETKSGRKRRNSDGGAVKGKTGIKPSLAIFVVHGGIYVYRAVFDF